MGVKIILSSILFVGLLLNGITQGKLLRFILPFWDASKQNVMCIVGSLLLQPTVQIGGITLSLPSGDDAMIATFAATIIVYKFKVIMPDDIKKKLLVMLGVWFAVWVFVKMIGYWLVALSGMPECMTQFEVTGVAIRFEWFSILFYAGIITAIGGLIGLTLKLIEENK